MNPSNFLATYGFYREGLTAAAGRLRAYMQKSESAVLDEPATAAALAAFLVRGLHCGALTDDETTELTGLDRATLDRLYLRR